VERVEHAEALDDGEGCGVPEFATAAAPTRILSVAAAI